MENPEFCELLKVKEFAPISIFWLRIEDKILHFLKF